MGETLKTVKAVEKPSNQLKSVEKRVKATLTFLEVCAVMGMSRPTLMKRLKKCGVKPIQNGRGGKMWLTSKDVEALQNGA